MKTLICIISVLLMYACSEKAKDMSNEKDLKEIDNLADRSDSVELELKKLEEERKRL